MKCSLRLDYADYFSRLNFENCSNKEKACLPEDLHPDPGTPGSQVATVLGRIGFPGGAEVKASACNMRELGSIPGSGRSPGEGNGNPLQCSCLESPMDGGAWWAAVRGSLRVGHD